MQNKNSSHSYFSQFFPFVLVCVKIKIQNSLFLSRENRKEKRKIKKKKIQEYGEIWDSEISKENFPKWKNHHHFSSEGAWLALKCILVLKVGQKGKKWNGKINNFCLIFLALENFWARGKLGFLFIYIVLVCIKKENSVENCCVLDNEPRCLYIVYNFMFKVCFHNKIILLPVENLQIILSQSNTFGKHTFCKIELRSCFLHEYSAFFTKKFYFLFFYLCLENSFNFSI